MMMGQQALIILRPFVLYFVFENILLAGTQSTGMSRTARFVADCVQLRGQLRRRRYSRTANGGAPRHSLSAAVVGIAGPQASARGLYIGDEACLRICIAGAPALF